ncbi:MAG: 2OG-Fe(II) oxygenase [Bacteroidetes bacterium]|nr:MAG: 2OG-Fe(II) oxygenase [Bacteroidota bacterium]
MSALSLFDRIADGLADTGYFSIPNFVSRDEALAIRDIAIRHKEEGEFRRAGIGKQIEYQLEKDIRGDEILWIDNEYTAPSIKSYLQRMEELQNFLNYTCFLGLKEYEIHFAVYPKGTRYARHSDRFKNNPHRVISFVLYLNPDWEEEDGGQLAIYLEGKDPVYILPEAGKLVCFRSEIEHEVLECNRARYSLTGWLLDQPVGLTFL